MQHDILSPCGYSSMQSGVPYFAGCLTADLLRIQKDDCVDGTLEWRLCKRYSAEEDTESSMLALPLVKAWGLFPLKVGIRESGGLVSLSLTGDLFKSVLFPLTHREAHVLFFHPFHFSFLTHEIPSFPFCPMLDTHTQLVSLEGLGV